MRPTSRWVVSGSIAAAAITWLAAAELRWPARAALVLLLAGLPAGVLGQSAAAADVPGRVPRSALYLASAAALWLLAALTTGAALAAGFTTRTLGLLLPPPLSLAGWTGGAIGAGLAVLAIGRALRVRESELLGYILPRTRSERLTFAALALSAGIGEELVFRGFLVPALARAMGAIVPAALLAAAVFGMLHAYQGTPGTVRAAVLGLVLTLPFVLSGSLLPSILAHTAIDVIAGLWLAPWLLRR
ncbi:MAG: CPBP family intramembrane metalloprotease [Gemmatimonadetes bacterium]|nr:CPBP family intramembrane metalloprotease [Gemmatimonadota bacterium]